MNKSCFAIEKAFENFCTPDLGTAHLLELRKLVSNLLLAQNFDRPHVKHGKYEEVYNNLLKFKANIMRRKTQSDTMTSKRLMNLPDPARAILLSVVASVFHNEIDDYTQIDFGNDRHVELLKVAVDRSIAKITNKQGRPVNEALDKFFIGLRDLYEEATGKKAIAEAHYSNKPKTDFEKLIYLGYKIIRPAQEYQAAFKAYERAISRNS